MQLVNVIRYLFTVFMQAVNVSVFLIKVRSCIDENLRALTIQKSLQISCTKPNLSSN